MDYGDIRFEFERGVATITLWATPIGTATATTPYVPSSSRARAGPSARAPT